MGDFDLILCGRRAIDGETGQVPGELAAALGLPCITDAEAVEKTAAGLRIRRRMEQGIVTLEACGPTVVSICEYAYPLRLPGILAMRKAKDKQVQLLTAEDLGLPPERCGLKGSRTKVVAMEAKVPGLRRGVKDTDLSVGIRRVAEICREVGK